MFINHERNWPDMSPEGHAINCLPALPDQSTIGTKIYPEQTLPQTDGQTNKQTFAPVINNAAFAFTDINLYTEMEFISMKHNSDLKITSLLEKWRANTNICRFSHRKR